MAFIDTRTDEDNYELFVAKVRSQRGECALKMSTFKDLCSVVKWLVELDDYIEVTLDNACGQDLTNYLSRHGFRVRVRSA